MRKNPDDAALAKIPGLKRIEHHPKELFQAEVLEMTHAVYSHDDTYGKFITVEEYIDCPPEKVFEYMAHPRSLEEWTYSVRDLSPSEIEGVDSGFDRIGKGTRIFSKTVSHREAMTVDYHCAWDQGEKLWMIYLNRIVPAELVFNRPGSVVLWTNCRHPFYEANPFPEASPPGRPVWVGDFWDYFYAGHAAELQNLKAILEYRHHNGMEVGPLL